MVSLLTLDLENGCLYIFGGGGGFGTPDIAQGYFWLCSGMTPSSSQGTECGAGIQTIVRVMLCKASTLFLLLPLWSYILVLQLKSVNIEFMGRRDSTVTCFGSLVPHMVSQAPLGDNPEHEARSKPCALPVCTPPLAKKTTPKNPNPKKSSNPESEPMFLEITQRPNWAC